MPQRNEKWRAVKLFFSKTTSAPIPQSSLRRFQQLLGTKWIGLMTAGWHAAIAPGGFSGALSVFTEWKGNFYAVDLIK
jgi:hypothetical protein